MQKHYRLSDRWNKLMNGLVPHEGEVWVADLERGISPAVLVIAFAAAHRLPEHRVLIEEVQP